jgi:hypothetical protein
LIREGISFSDVLVAREYLQVRMNMQAADFPAAQRNDVVNVTRNTIKAF